MVYTKAFFYHPPSFVSSGPQVLNPPPSPFYVSDAAEVDLINDESSEMLTREVR